MTCSACGSPVPDGARFCPSCGVPTVHAQAERRLVTAFFCDLVGSTGIAERLDPEVYRAILDEYTGLARRAIERNGGTVAAFQGDGAVGVFGLPVAREDDALRAARAGLDLLAAVTDAREAAAHGVVLQARVGIDSGEVVGDLAIAASGALGGDVLNTAARLQTQAEPGQVIVGEGAISLLGDRAELLPLPPVTLKGKAEPVAAAMLVSVRPGPRRPSATPFVGRDRHLATLGRALEDAVADGAPVLATVLGDPGIGKSRLLDTFLGRLTEVTVLRVSVAAAGEGASLEPVADLVRAAGGGGRADEVLERLSALLARRPDAAAIDGALRSLLGIGEGSAVEHAWALRRMLEALAARRPVVAALDDLHWAAPVLFDLVEDVARWTRGPILLLCVARPDLLDARRTWAGGMPRSVSITVGPLAEDESRSLAEALVGPTTSWTDRLVATAEGNPLFLEQLAAQAREAGDAWDPASSPSTVRALLEARLDRCAPDVGRLLGLASVQGTRFRLGILRQVSDEGVDVQAALREAERAHLAREIEPDTGAFEHALIRETAYGRLPKATRAEMHIAVADLLPHAEDELAGVHLERAAALYAELGHPAPDVARRAGNHLARSGARAFARLDLITSSDILDRAARLLPEGTRARLEILPDLAVALMEIGRTREASALLSGAVEEAEMAGSRRDAIRIRLQQLALYVFDRPSDDVIRQGIIEGRALLEELARLGDDVGLAQGWIVVEYLHWLVGEMTQAEEGAGRSVAHAERAGRLREQLQAGGDEVTSLILGPRPVTEIRERARQLLASGNPIVAAGGYAAAAAAAALSGDERGYHEAATRWRELIDAGGLEYPGADHALIGLALVRLEVGDPPDAEALLRDGIDTMERLGDVWVLNGAGWLLALALARQGRSDEAATLADALDDRYREMEPYGSINRGVALSTARAVRGRPDEARSIAQDAADLARRTDLNLSRALAVEHLARLLHTSDPAAAIAALEEVAALDARSGNVVGAARVSQMLAASRAETLLSGDGS